MAFRSVIASRRNHLVVAVKRLLDTLGFSDYHRNDRIGGVMACYGRMIIRALTQIVMTGNSGSLVLLASIHHGQSNKIQVE